MRTKNNQRKAVIAAERLMRRQDGGVRDAHHLIVFDETYRNFPQYYDLTKINICSQGLYRINE